MRILRNHLITAFGLFRPERLINDLYRKFCDKNSLPEFGHYIPDFLTYRSFALEYFNNLTYEEVDNLYGHMRRIIKKRGELCGGESIFALIPEYTSHVLELDSSIPVCRQSERLNWRSCYLQLGQDMLTTAHLAYISINESRDFRFFGWPAIIGTDDRRLIEILDKGLAENHFHLNGSTRSFDLSWMCFMNHPRQITAFFAEKGGSREEILNNRFEENLYTATTSGASDNQMSWKHRLFCACWLRVILFLWLQEQKFPYDLLPQTISCPTKPCPQDSGTNCHPACYFFDMVKMLEIVSGMEYENMVDAAKFLYGGCGKFKQPDGKEKIFDYAITCAEMHSNSPCRSLSGERKLLYDAFRVIYSGKVNTEPWLGFADMFYLYLLIKTQFRHEIIQSNGRYGFKNFVKYQDRKDIIFENFPEYALEAKNLSVNDGIKRRRINSLEIRVTPKAEYYEQRGAIREIDDSIVFLCNKKIPKSSKERKAKGLKRKWFYVLHFPKIPEKTGQKKEFEFMNKPRNFKLRTKSKIQAFSIAHAIERYNWLSSRIRGIDACTFEIGCRPEVFATEFRFLRSFVCTELSEAWNYSNDILQPRISATYHVGEDFLDIIDGLRAIDEALLFLDMKPGERLGHALVLGVDAHEYYALKNHWIVLTKQDHLDNIVWALNKAKALNINLGSAFKQKLYDKAASLIYEIYDKNIQIYNYYNSWLLRGDDPALYRFGFYDNDEYQRGFAFPANNSVAQYGRQRILKSYHPQEYSAVRENVVTADLYFRYHFDYEARKKGEALEEIQITEDYIKMAKKLQSGMRREIAQHRIGIECNLSSNVLIGSVNLYEKHPIFTFYPVLRSEHEVSQFVTINTDDQGVFDTSLEEEFTLLECTLRSMRNQDQTPLYSDEEIYKYLERIRQNGFSQAFSRADINSNNFSDI